MHSYFGRKLGVPQAARPLLPRPGLVAELDAAVTTQRIVIVTAAAGWGKTSLLAQWAAATTLPVAWFTLDRSDRDPVQALEYLLRAVAAHLDPVTAQALTRSVGHDPQQLQARYRDVALAIAQAPLPFVLVLDDVHELDDVDLSLHPASAVSEPNPLLDLLATLAEYALSCHLLLASRTVVPLRSLARLGAHGLVTVLHTDKLQFTAQQVVHLATMTHNLLLSQDHVVQLMEQLHGWPAGVAVALDHAAQQSKAPVPTTNKTLPTEQLYAFFAEQIIQPLAVPLQHFLENTSVWDVLSPERCLALYSDEHCLTLLQAAQRRGVFVVKGDGTLQYHSLFRAFLQTRLARVPSRYHQILRAAGAQYALEGEVEHAMQCYLDVGDVETANDVVAASIPDLRQRGRHTTALRCLEQLGAAARGPLPPTLLLMQARLYSDLAQWSHAAMALDFVVAFGDDALQQQAYLLLADLELMQGNLTQAAALLNQIPDEHLPTEVRVDWLLVSGRIAVLRGEASLAITQFEAALQHVPTVLRRSQDPSLIAYLYDHLGWAHIVANNHSAARRALQRADLAWQACNDHGRRAMTLNNISAVELSLGNTTAARTALATGLQLAEAVNFGREQTYLWYSLAEVDLVDGALPQARERLDRAALLATRYELESVGAAVTATALWCSLLQSDTLRARSLLVQLNQSQLGDQPHPTVRYALAMGLLVLDATSEKNDEITAFIAVVDAAGAELLPAEQAAYLLLRAVYTGTDAAWEAALHAIHALLPPLRDGLLHWMRQSGSTTARNTTLSRWIVRALGSFTCLRDGQRCSLRPLYAALLVRLLEADSASLSADLLWEDIWGTEKEINIAAMHQAIARLRKATQLDITLRDGICRIATPRDAIDFDVQQFVAALEQPTQPKAVALALYGGPFLPDAPLSAALWVEGRRMFLQTRYLDTREVLAQQLEQSDPQGALAHYQAILQIEPAREHTAQRVLRLALHFGNLTLLDTTYNQLKAHFDNFGFALDVETQALYRQRDNIPRENSPQIAR